MVQYDKSIFITINMKVTNTNPSTTPDKSYSAKKKKQENESQQDKQTENEDDMNMGKNIQFSYLRNYKQMGPNQYNEGFQHVGVAINKWSFGTGRKNDEMSDKSENKDKIETDKSKESSPMYLTSVQRIQIKSKSSINEDNKLQITEQNNRKNKEASPNKEQKKKENLNYHTNQKRRNKNSKDLENLKKRNQSLESLRNDSYNGSIFSKINQTEKLKNSKKTKSISNMQSFQSETNTEHTFKRQSNKIKDKNKFLNFSLEASNQIVDIRKKAQTNNFVIVKQSKTIFTCLRSINFPPIQRVLTFILIYQTTLSFLIPTSNLFKNYYLLLLLLLLVFPTYFGYKCVKSLIIHHDKPRINDQMSMDLDKEIGKVTKISNSYVQQSKVSSVANMEESQDVNSISQTIQMSDIQSGSKYFLFSHNKNVYPSKCLLVVPYLHNNQFQYFAKCSSCSSSHHSSKIKHCHRCHTCHYGYDHYCKWLAICVDVTNYEYFVKFVANLWVISLILIGSVGFMLYCSEFSYEMLIGFGILELQILFGFGFCTYIFGYHLMIMWKGVTTKQYLQGQTYHDNNCSPIKTFSHSIDLDYFQNFLSEIPYTADTYSKQNIMSMDQYIIDKQNQVAMSKRIEGEKSEDEQSAECVDPKKLLNIPKIDSNRDGEFSQQASNEEFQGTLGSLINIKKASAQSQANVHEIEINRKRSNSIEEINLSDQVIENSKKKKINKISLEQVSIQQQAESDQSPDKFHHK